MTKAIIVDDEPYVRQMIKSMIRWEQLSLELVGEFFNGEDAYREIAQDAGIELVLTDLRMPVMDGLNLIKQSLALRPRLKFVVVSAYDDFHLVKDAFLLGAKDYLLKSEMTEDHIHQVLSNLLSDHAAIAGSEPMKENLLGRAIAGSIASGEMETLKLLLFKNESKKLVLAVLKLVPADRNAPPPPSLTPEIADGLTRSGEALRFESEMRCEIFQVSPWEYVLFLLFSPLETESFVIRQLKFMYDGIRPEGLRVNMGVSRISADFARLPLLIQEARRAADSCFLAGNGSMALYTTRLDEPSAWEIDSAKQISLLKKGLTSVLFDNGDANIGQIAIDNRSVRAGQIQAIKNLYTNYHFAVIDFAQQNGRFDDIREISDAFETHLKTYGDLDALNRWLRDAFEAIKPNKGEHSVVSQVKRFVEENFARDITLQLVAQKFGLNSSYLSRLFSEKEQTNFVDYLAQLRIAKAIELIRSSHLKIYEISEEVGYTSPEHFSRTFKKITGKSPKHFMDSRR